MTTKLDIKIIKLIIEKICNANPTRRSDSEAFRYKKLDLCETNLSTEQTITSVLTYLLHYVANPLANVQCNVKN